MNCRQAIVPVLRFRFLALFETRLGKRKLSLTRSKSSRFPVYRVGMQGITPDGIALFAGFVAVAVWLPRR
jgi:hypothetical protein